jgi:predicted  nucleic acid-binding Zn-ribbon protein
MQKKLVLEEMLLLSLSEKRARKIAFDRSRTIVRGDNQTGKSCLVKSIYRTFGAEPPLHPRWKKADVSSLIRFTVDQVRYAILKHGSADAYSIFDDNNKLIDTFDSVTTGLAPFFANLLNFKIKLPDREQKQITPPSNYLFLPFYIDQDKSWASNWSGFQRLQQLPNWRDAIINYHTGIKGNEWYQAKGEADQVKNEIKKLTDEKGVLRNVLDNLQEKLANVQFDISIESFKQEISELLKECILLNAEQLKLKARLVDLHNHRIIIDTQIKITEQALNEARRDYVYMVEELPDGGIECPTCGAEYHNAFAERFAIAQDEQKCFELLQELYAELAKVEQKIRYENGKYTGSMKEMERINGLLASRQGDISLKDLIESEGKKEIRSIFEQKITDTMNSIHDKSYALDVLTKKLEKLQDKDRQGEILDTYRQLMKTYLQELNVTSLTATSYKRIAATISESGSAKPRALTAYYFSILQIIQKYSSAAFCPIVIDAPNQQEQDDKNLQRILNFIKTHQPEDAQLILALGKDLKVDFGGEVIELNDHEKLLQESEYESVYSELRPFLDVGIMDSRQEPGFHW